MVHPDPEDKSTWAPGPWQHEPDELEWIDQRTGYPCRILRGPVGALCGYVGVTKDHPAYGIGCDDRDHGIRQGSNTEWWQRHISHWVQYKVSEITIHGGLTFADYMEMTSDKSATWAFGFDCAHAYDHSPAIQNSLLPDENYCDIEYVKLECESLAWQLETIADESSRTGRKVGISKQSISR